MLFKNAYIFTPSESFVHGSFYVENGRFGKILDIIPEEEGTDLNGAYFIPGLIDVHNHGNSNSDLSDGDYNGLVKMGNYLASVGVTSFAPATLTLPYEVLSKAFATGAKLNREQPKGCSRLMGMQMEGPFFNEKKKGAQNALHLRLPDFDAFKKLYDDCGGLVRIVDIAPELPGAKEFIEKASKLCTVSEGHTDAEYEDAKMGFEAGARQCTHLFNAMPSIHHRKPGVIGAASERDDVVAELICDGIHVHPSSVRMAFKLFPDRICLISDALRCCGMPNGKYDLGGQDVFLENGVARLSDGNIAGAATNLYDCMLNAVSFGISKEKAITAATATPAKTISRYDEIGSIEEGKLADFVVCDEDLARKDVYMGGEKI